MSVYALLNSTCTISRKTTAVSSTTYAGVNTWSNAATGVACTIQADATREADFAAKETGIVSAWGYFEYGTDIRTGDRVVPNDGQYSGVTLTVLGPPQDQAGRQAFVRVPLEYRIGGGTR